MNQDLLRREARKVGSVNNRIPRAETTFAADIRFAARARQVLRQNDMGDWTRAAPTSTRTSGAGTARSSLSGSPISIPVAPRGSSSPSSNTSGEPERYPTLSSIRRLRPRVTSQDQSTGLALQLRLTHRLLRPIPVAFVSPQFTPSPPYASGKWPRDAGERESKKRELSCGRSTPSSSFGTAT